MSLNVPNIGPFRSVWIAKAGVFSWLQISDTTTDKNTFDFNIPQAFNFKHKKFIQAGPPTLKVHIDFLSDDPFVSRLAMGNWQDTAFIDTPSTFTQYSLLCVHPNATSPSSLWIPACETQKSLNELFSKTEATTQALDFTFTALSRFADAVSGYEIYYKRTVAELQSIVPNSPI